MTSELHRLRDTELDEYFRRNPESWKDAIAEHGGRKRLIDTWVVYSIQYALRNIHKGRWNFSPEARVALLNARGAVNRLADAMRGARR